MSPQNITDAKLVKVVYDGATPAKLRNDPSMGALLQSQPLFMIAGVKNLEQFPINDVKNDNDEAGISSDSDFESEASSCSSSSSSADSLSLSSMRLESSSDESDTDSLGSLDSLDSLKSSLNNDNGLITVNKREFVRLVTEDSPRGEQWRSVTLLGRGKDQFVLNEFVSRSASEPWRTSPFNIPSI